MSESETAEQTSTVVDQSFSKPTHISTFPFQAICPLSEQENLDYESTYISAQKRSSKEFKAHGPNDGKNKKRKWGPITSENTETKESIDTLEKKPRMPKKKVVLLMSYCGTGYQGMQINPDVPSIELDLHKALAASGAVSTDNSMDPGKIAFMRCARTDKGVHAGGQVVSLKMIIQDSDIIERINARLPPQIRVWGYARVQQQFHAKHHCDSRIYEYILPTSVLKKVDPTYYPLSKIGVAAGVTFENMGRAKMEPIEIPEHTDNEKETIQGYRTNHQELEEFRAILNEYVGTHNYHNFTIGRKFEDKSSIRYIISFICSEPFQRDNTEWVSLKVKGQSFMLHQIRKMIGLAVMMMRTSTPKNLIASTFSQTRINIPKAPALGLLLERPLFENYNSQIQPKGVDRDVIDFDQYKELIDQFKEDWIYKAQIQEEISKGHFLEWTRVVDSNPDDYGWYLTSNGSIMEEYKPPYIHATNLNPSIYRHGGKSQSRSDGEDNAESKDED
ncbi:hypothetical protein BDV3_005129 [Batrachochytrium dendrobatidis]